MASQNESLVWVRGEVLERLVAEADDKAPLETGGILMGYFGEANRAPVILHAGGPGPRAIHKAYGYCPDYDHDEATVAHLYEDSGRKLVYLGDWHTHLGPTERLSYKDRRTLRRIATDKDARVQEPIMLIMSRDSEWALAVWQGSVSKSILWRKRLCVARLAPRAF